MASGYKQILVHLEGEGRDSPRVVAAAAIAERFGAAVDGILVRVRAYAPTFAMAVVRQRIADLQAEIYQRRAVAARDAFSSNLASAFVETNWHYIEGEIPSAIAANAHFADLVVMGAPQKDGLADFEAVGDCLMTVPRPVLVVPDSYQGTPLGRRALVAWNGSREAARALASAIPLLREGEATVVLIEEEKHSSAMQDADEILEWLGRHGVVARLARISMRAGGPGTTLIEEAKARAADMLVMGAYGRSRLREFVLGGATHDLLSLSPVPVLMQH